MGKEESRSTDEKTAAAKEIAVFEPYGVYSDDSARGGTCNRADFCGSLVSGCRRRDFRAGTMFPPKAPFFLEKKYVGSSPQRQKESATLSDD